MNTDGSLVGANGLAGCGGVIRDSNGCWIEGFAMSINTTSSIAAQLWALREGLHLCVDAHIQAVEIELDASAAISLVVSNINSNVDLFGFIDHCRDLLLQLSQVKMFHCFKEANCCADALARLGSSQDNVSLHFVSPLLCCTPCVC